MHQHAATESALKAAVSRRLINRARHLRHGLIVGICAVTAACGVGGTVGGGDISNEISFRIQGTAHTPFMALITDTIASWTIQSVAPVDVVILNDNPPVRIYATKLEGNSALLTVQSVSGGSEDLGIVSTQAPFGSVVIQTGKLGQIAPPADPDTRLFVKGSSGETFDGLIEDLNIGFALDDVVRTIFLFENPTGRVDGLFSLTSADLGPLKVDLSVGGEVVASASGNPTVQIRSP